jgi:hypothetical protein
MTRMLHTDSHVVCTLFVSKARRAEGPSPRGKKEKVYISRAVRVSSKEPAAIAEESEGNQVYLKQDGPLCSVLNELAAP